jgi:hypothetical protein
MPLGFRHARSWAFVLFAAACATAGCSGSGGSASAVSGVTPSKPSPSTSPPASASPSGLPSPSPSPTPSPTPQPSRAPNSCTTSTSPVVSGTERFIIGFDGGPDLDGAYVASLSWTPGTYGEQIFQATSPSGPFTKVQDRGFIGSSAGCDAFADIPHLRAGVSYYFELAGYTDETHLTPVSSAAVVTVPPNSGDTGQPTFGVDVQTGTGVVRWPNPVQGYHSFTSDAIAGPYFSSSDSGFAPDQELLGFEISTGHGHTICVKVQGYSSSGQPGPLEGPVCANF